MAGTAIVSTPITGNMDSRSSGLYEIPVSFIADAATASIPDAVIGGTGYLNGLTVKFDDIIHPNALTVTVKDKNGIVRAAGTLTASGVIDIDKPTPFVDGLVVTFSGNTTNSAEATIYLYIF